MYADAVQDAIDELGRLPGIGPKSAQRLAFHLMKLPVEDVERFVNAISEMKSRIQFCLQCFNISEAETCGICKDSRRETGILCVIEEARDIVAVERTGEFRGRYHVLGGAISPIEGIGPDQLNISQLLARIDSEQITEVILATNPNIEGEATAMYLARLLSPLGVTVSKVATGLPVGGDLEYADELTLGQELEKRHILEEN